MHAHTALRRFARRPTWFCGVAFALVLAPLAQKSQASTPDGGGARRDGAAAVARADELPLAIERGEGHQRLIVPRDEELLFHVTLGLGALGRPQVGDVKLSSKVTPFFPEGLLRVEPKGGEQLEQAAITAHAVGGYAFYSVDQTISTRILPQAWPRYVHRNEMIGSENKKRELLVGERDGRWTSQRRSDRHCKGCEDRAHFMKPNWVWQEEAHCVKCKRAEHRVWRDPETMDVPEHAVDMVTAMMVARSMVLDHKSSTKFTLVDKDDLWNVEVSLAGRERRTIEAGTFDAVEVKLVTRKPGVEKHDDEFEGLFGLHGTISIWMHEASGVPIEVRGTVPAGPFELDVAIELAAFHGTPPEFVRAADAGDEKRK